MKPPKDPAGGTPTPPTASDQGVTPGLTYKLGMDCAQDWLDNAPAAVVPRGSAATWRACCLADLVNQYRRRPDFVQLLAAWERGFDETMSAVGGGPTPAPPRRALHQPFSWLRDELRADDAAQFVATTFDVANGIQTCMELIQAANLERRVNDYAGPGEAVAPILEHVDTERLIFLVAATARLMADAAEERISRMNNRVQRERAG